MVVLVGAAVTDAPVVADHPVAGDHLYVPPVPAPEAVNTLPASPAHMLVEVGDVVITGGAQFTWK